jgi:hypothetical protein
MTLLRIYILHKIANNEQVDRELLKIIKDDENAYRSGKLCTSLQFTEKRIS